MEVIGTPEFNDLEGVSQYRWQCSVSNKTFLTVIGRYQCQKSLMSQILGIFIICHRKVQ